MNTIQNCSPCTRFARIKTFLKYIFSILVFLALMWVGYFLIYGNFHKVDKDVYRSAQLFSFNMPYYIQKYHIQSILNLRGPSKQSWYMNEQRISDEYNLTHYDYGIGDRELATSQQMHDIIKIIAKAPKPILIHCKAGADRTSLVSSLYLYAIKHDANPAKEISIVYGHFPWLGSKTVAMDMSFKQYMRENPQE